MKFIRVIKASNEWWKKYYKVTKPTKRDLSDSKEALIEEGLEDEYNVVSVLTAKPKYEDILSSQDIQSAYLSNKNGDKQVYSIVMGRIFPISEEDILDSLDEEDPDPVCPFTF